MTKKDNEDFENSAKFSKCDNDCIDNDVKVFCYLQSEKILFAFLQN